MSTWITRVLCFVPALFGGLVATLLGLTCGAVHRASPYVGVHLVLVPEGAWLARAWRYSTTFGYTVLVHPDAQKPENTQRVVAHELIHVRQFELCGVFYALVLFVSGFDVVLLAAWPFCWLFYYLCAGAIAVWNGADPYRGNVLEHHAYGMQDRE